MNISSQVKAENVLSIIYGRTVALQHQGMVLGSHSCLALPVVLEFLFIFLSTQLFDLKNVLRIKVKKNSLRFNFNDYA